MDKPRTSFAVTAEEMVSLRELAASLGFYTSRGPGAGTIGNITALLSAIAEAHRQDPKSVAAMMRGLLGDVHPGPP